MYVEQVAPYLSEKPENDVFHTTIVSKGYFELTPVTCVSSMCNLFLQAYVDYLAKCEGKIQFIADFTHDTCRAKMKLG